MELVSARAAVVGNRTRDRETRRLPDCDDLNTSNHLKCFSAAYLMNSIPDAAD